MSQVLTTVPDAEGGAERDRVAWNLPRPRIAAPSPETLDWYGFLARYFPGRRRHNFKALTAYHAYRSSGGTVMPSSEPAPRNEEEQESSSRAASGARSSRG